MSCDHYRQIYVNTNGDLHHLPCATPDCPQGTPARELVLGLREPSPPLSFHATVTPAMRVAIKSVSISRGVDRRGWAWEHQAHPIIEDYQRTMRRELAETCAILADLLEQRGESWLAQLMGRREELRNALASGELTGYDNACDDCGVSSVVGNNYSHLAACAHAALMRIVGGPDETQRQVDAAHGVALNLAPVAGPYAVNRWSSPPPRMIGLGESVGAIPPRRGDE